MELASIFKHSGEQCTPKEDFKGIEAGIKRLQRVMVSCGFNLTQQALVWKRVNAMAIDNTKAIHAKIRLNEAQKLQKAITDADNVPGKWSQAVINGRSKRGK